MTREGERMANTQEGKVTRTWLRAILDIHRRNTDGSKAILQSAEKNHLK